MLTPNAGTRSMAVTETERFERLPTGIDMPGGDAEMVDLGSRHPPELARPTLSARVTESPFHRPFGGNPREVRDCVDRYCHLARSETLTAD